MIPLKKFMLAGNATFTARSVKTGCRFTFRVRQPAENKPHFVSVLRGADNESSYSFLGTIFEGTNYRHSQKSKVGEDAPSAKAFAWIWNHADKLDGVEIFHEGRCCRCGRKLTTPESVTAGIGPECASILGC